MQAVGGKQRVVVEAAAAAAGSVGVVGRGGQVYEQLRSVRVGRVPVAFS